MYHVGAATVDNEEDDDDDDDGSDFVKPTSSGETRILDYQR